MIILLDPTWARTRTILNHRFQHFRQLRNIMRWIEQLEPPTGFTTPEQAFIQNTLLPLLTAEQRNEATVSFRYFEALVNERKFNEKRNSALSDK